MKFLLGLFLGYLLFSKRKENNRHEGVRIVKVTTPVYKKPPK